MGVTREISGLDLYHVVSRGTGRQLIFEDDADRLLFLDLLNTSRKLFGVEIYAYCLMGNHFHLLLHAPLEHVSRFMKRVCGTHAQRFNEKAGRTGHLFQERYKSEPIDDESYLLTVVHYIHHNPTRAGLDEADKYPWSSYKEYIDRPQLCATLFVLDLVGGVDGFASLHADEASLCCLDVDSPRSIFRAMKDDELIAFAESVLDGARLDGIKALSRSVRDEAIRKLRSAGLSIRQVERLTGIGRAIVAHATEKRDN